MQVQFECLSKFLGVEVMESHKQHLELPTYVRKKEDEHFSLCQRTFGVRRNCDVKIYK